MNNTIDPVTGYPDSLAVSNDKGRSAVSWAAIAAGAVVAASTSLLLVALGGGFGLASLSPWTHTGASVATFTAQTTRSSTSVFTLCVRPAASGARRR